MDKNEPIGYLFDTVAFYNEEQLTNILENISEEQSFFFLNKALEFAYKKGAFSLVESEILSKSLRIFNNNFGK